MRSRSFLGISRQWKRKRNPSWGNVCGYASIGGFGIRKVGSVLPYPGEGPHGLLATDKPGRVFLTNRLANQIGDGGSRLLRADAERSPKLIVHVKLSSSHGVWYTPLSRVD